MLFGRWVFTCPLQYFLSAITSINVPEQRTRFCWAFPVVVKCGTLMSNTCRVMTGKVN